MQSAPFSILNGLNFLMNFRRAVSYGFEYSLGVWNIICNHFSHTYSILNWISLRHIYIIAVWCKKWWIMDQGGFYSHISMLFSDQVNHTCIVVTILSFLDVSMKNGYWSNMWLWFRLQKKFHMYLFIIYFCSENI